MNGDAVVLIPYIEQESGAAEVWIGRCQDNEEDPVTRARRALTEFAAMDTDMDDTAGLRDHCDLWGADRILLPTDETPVRWTAYSIDGVLEGRLVDPSEY